MHHHVETSSELVPVMAEKTFVAGFTEFSLLFITVAGTEPYNLVMP
jgi:hypothetical protein